MKRPLLGAAALVAAGALTTLNAAPGFGAHTVSQAEGTALRLSIAGSPADSGTVRATNDGSGEVKTGDTNPVVGVLGNQNLIDTGVLLQDASAGINGQNGVSRACAGVAGQGGAMVEVGDAGCIAPGDALGLNIANLDLAGTVLINPDSAIGGLAALNELGPALLEPITGALTDALDPISDLGIGGTLGAVDAWCDAAPGSATGDAHLADTRLTLTLPGQDPIVLAELPANPAPNRKVVTQLDKFFEELLIAVETDLNNSLSAEPGGPLAPLGDLVADEIRPILVERVLAQIAPQLQPLEAGLLDVTLNKQYSDGPGHIGVTALDLQLAPAAKEFVDSSLVGLELGNVECGPNSRIHTVQRESSGRESSGKANNPEVPTVVNSGLDDGGAASSGDQGADSALLAGGLLALAGAAGALGYRRFAAR